MKRRTWYSFGLAALIVLTALVAVGCGDSGDLPSAGADQTTSTSSAGDGSTATTAADDGPLTASLNGAGATFPGPLYLEWIGEFQQAEPGVAINYQAIGSGGGIQQFTQGTVDFGASDAPMKDEEITEAEKQGAKVLHIPTVFGAVTLAYNLEGVTELKLDSETLAAIFLGTVKQWNDPKLAALNPGVALPADDIQVVHRSDSSGTTSIFTTYLEAVSPEWKDKVGSGKEVSWPVGVGGQGNKGVAAVVQQQAGSMGYVELSYATESNLAVAQLENQAGNMITPSLASTSAAAEGVDFPEDLRFDVVNSEGKDAYPIVGATWILAWDTMKDPAKAAALKGWLTWVLNDGTAIAEELHYAPLPESLKELALEKVNTIK